MFLYAIIPSQICYISIFTEEHLASAVTVYAVYLLILMYDTLSNSNKMPSRCFYLALLCGILCGFNACLKDWGIVAIIAFAIVLILSSLFENKKKFISLIVLMLIILCCRHIISAWEMSVSEKVVGRKCDSSLAVHLFLFLDPSTNYLGANAGDSEEYYKMMEYYGYNYNELHKEVYKIVFNRIKENVDRIPQKIQSKLFRSYGRGNIELFDWWIFGSLESAVRQNHAILINAIKMFDYTVYSGLLILIVLGAIMTKDNRVMFLIYIISGGIASQLLINSTDRYKYSIMCIWIVVAVIVMDMIKVGTICWKKDHVYSLYDKANIVAK